MVKYSYELKKQVVQDYLDGLGGYKKLAQKYDLPTKSIILQWLNVYEIYGFEGLKIKGKKRVYSSQFKEKAVEFYLTKDISYREAANQLKIDNPSLLATWVTKFNHQGMSAFNSNRKSRESTQMSHKTPNKVESQRIRELEIQLRRAQVELDCLSSLSYAVSSR